MKNISSWSQVPLMMDIPLAASIFSVTEQTVRNWIKQRNLPVVKTAGTIRIEKSDLLQWIKENKSVSPK